MAEFKQLLEDTGEVGYVEEVYRSIIYVSGLPKARPMEVVMFENGGVGQVISLLPDYIEVLLLTNQLITVGTKVARTGDLMKVNTGMHLLGKNINPLGLSKGVVNKIHKESQSRLIDIPPPGMSVRKNITRPFETGVSMVDMIIPLGKGQRELVVGDRKTGKTQLLIQSMVNQARKGMVCIYAAIAKKRMDIKSIENIFNQMGVTKNTIIVATSSADPAGLIYLTPFTAMTIAEYFRDVGYDVYIVLDDLSAHAKLYREIMLLAKRFPGRNSYPGDIFYLHSRLLERAGNFEFIKKDNKGNLVKLETSITCLPVAELTLGDLSGYIQTNLMAMTDGHILFDTDLYNQGRRPAINPFISVTRVGRQAQTNLLRDINRQVTKFMVYIQKLREFLHFGAELSESTQRTIAMGDRITSFFDQPVDKIINVNVSTLIMGALWGGYWRTEPINQMKTDLYNILNLYNTDKAYGGKIDKLIESSENLADLVTAIKDDESLILKKERNK